jgi:hypothetical protein
MKFHSELRGRSPTGLPQWLGSVVVLPWLSLMPDEDGRWSVGAGNASTGRNVRVDGRELAELLNDWAEDPEGALTKWWGRASPIGLGASAETSDRRQVPGGTTAEDLGL